MVAVVAVVLMVAAVAAQEPEKNGLEDVAEMELL